MFASLLLSLLATSILASGKHTRNQEIPKELMNMMSCELEGRPRSDITGFDSDGNEVTQNFSSDDFSDDGFPRVPSSLLSLRTGEEKPLNKDQILSMYGDHSSDEDDWSIEWNPDPTLEDDFYTGKNAVDTEDVLLTEDPEMTKLEKEDDSSFNFDSSVERK